MGLVQVAERGTAAVAGSDDEFEAFMSQVSGWYTATCAVSLIGVGHRTGLLEAIATGPATSAELAIFVCRP